MFLTTFSSSGAADRSLLIKTLASSLMRSLFGGDLEILKNCSSPLFRIDRRNANEVLVRAPASGNADSLWHDQILSFYSNLGEDRLFTDDQWLVFADAAGLALRNVDHLIPSSHPSSQGQEVDLIWAKVHCPNQVSGSGSVSPGLWAVRSRHLSLIFERLKEVWREKRDERTEEQIWTEVVEGLPLRKRPFEKGEVYAPPIGAVDWGILSRAAYVTVPDWPEKEQWSFLQSLYFGTYFGDDTGLMLNILDP